MDDPPTAAPLPLPLPAPVLDCAWPALAPCRSEWRLANGFEGEAETREGPAGDREG